MSYVRTIAQGRTSFNLMARQSPAFAPGLCLGVVRHELTNVLASAFAAADLRCRRVEKKHVMPIVTQQLIS
jgi:hypothetical protein